MLPFGRTLVGNSSLLALDEPAKDVAPIIVKDRRKQLLKLNELWMTICAPSNDRASNEEVKTGYLML
jgi:ABC-type branched-subunit amino acid transport system ATPase component